MKGKNCLKQLIPKKYKYWFALENKWLETNSRIDKPDFYKKLFIENIEGQSDTELPNLIFPIRVEKHQLTDFFPHAMSLEYLQDNKNTSCLGSLASALYESGYEVAEKYITN